jgi:drug/metabolite transporter (DMT)-like permease
MTNLLLSIVFSAMLFVILRLFPRMKVITFNGIVVNYFVAAALSFCFTGNASGLVLPEGEILLVAFVTGGMFITVFFITGLTTQRTGVAVASVASKMSMVIPVLAGLALYDEDMGILKALGISLAFPAVYLVSKPGSGEDLKKFRVRDFGLPVLLFVGAGVVDTMIKAVQHFLMTGENRNMVIMYIFASAGLIGIIRVILLSIKHKRFITFHDLLGGVLLGSSNYFSLYFLIRCLELPGVQSSTVFTIVNTGVVVLSALLAAVMFKEHFTRDRIAGTILAVVSIIVLAI